MLKYIINSIKLQKIFAISLLMHARLKSSVLAEMCFQRNRQAVLASRLQTRSRTSKYVNIFHISLKYFLLFFPQALTSTPGTVEEVEAMAKTPSPASAVATCAKEKWCACRTSTFTSSVSPARVWSFQCPSPNHSEYEAGMEKIVLRRSNLV